MNTYVALSCLLAVVGMSHAGGIGPVGLGGWGGGLGWGSGLGWGGPIIGAPILAPAVSTANLIKAAPIPVVKTVAAPIVSPVGLGWGGLGWGGLGWGGRGVGWNGVGVGLGGKGVWGPGINTWGGYGRGLGWGH